MGKKLDLTGQKFGRLTAIEAVSKNDRGLYVWKFNCECGNNIEVIGASVKSGNTSSCGCKLHDTLLKRNITHGLSKHPVYKVWKGMFKRCYNENDERYKNYGGRGIKVDDAFEYFPNFLTEMGERPEDGQRWSVGRIDNNGHYAPGNVRWEIDLEQARNHTKQSNNTSGIVGIRRRVRNIGAGIYTTIIATVGKGSGKITKEISVDKYGEDLAMQIAMEFRSKCLKLLEYADSHGKDKLEVN